MDGDRRVRRSARVETALGYQLQSCVDRAKLDALMLVDEDGLVVATSEWEDDRSEELAAILPLMVRGSPEANVFLGNDAEEELLVNCFQAEGAPLYLCAVGNSTLRTQGELARAQQGVLRILN